MPGERSSKRTLGNDHKINTDAANLLVDLPNQITPAKYVWRLKELSLGCRIL